MDMAFLRYCKYWEFRADGARGIAGLTADPIVKSHMLNLAKSYDRLAQHVRQAGPQPADRAGDQAVRQLLLELAETYKELAKNRDGE